MIKYLLIALASMVALAGAQSVRVARLKTDVANVQAELREAKASIKAYETAVVDAGTISQLAAEACRSTIQVRVQHQTEAQGIRNAPDPNAASVAYDRLLCARPEARDHPTCAALPR